MQRSTLAKRVWLLFFLAIVVCFLYGLGRAPLMGPDEPRYAQVAREMFTRGDFVTPTLGGHTWFEKPALLYWLMMASYSAFGVTEFAARFGPACSGLLTALILFWTGRRIERAAEDKEKPKGLGQWSSLALATTGGLMIFSRGATVDIVMTMTITLALACFYVSEIERDMRRRLWLLAGFYGAIGLSLLAKGLVGLVIPFGVVGTYFLIGRKWPDRRVLTSALWGIPLAVAIASLWYWPVTAQHGWLFIDEFFVQHHFQRFVSNKYHHPQPFYFYLGVMLILTFPWTPFLIGSLVGTRPSNFRKDDVVSRFRIFALAWLIVPVAFFSLSASKLPGYVLPALPGGALLIGDYLVKFLRGERNKIAMRITGLLLLCLVIAGAFYVRRMQLVSGLHLWLMAIPMAIAGLFVTLRIDHRRACVMAIIGSMLATIVLAVAFASERVGERESIQHLLQLAAERGYRDTTVYGLHAVDFTAEFYASGRFAHEADGKPVRFEGPQQVLAVAGQNNASVLVIVPVEYVLQLTDYSPISTEVIGDNGKVALVAVRKR